MPGITGPLRQGPRHISHSAKLGINRDAFAPYDRLHRLFPQDAYSIASKTWFVNNNFAFAPYPALFLGHPEEGAGEYRALRCRTGASAAGRPPGAGAALAAPSIGITKGGASGRPRSPQKRTIKIDIFSLSVVNRNAA